MSNQDVRWEQRFANFNRAMVKLKNVMDLIDPNLEDEEIDENITELEKEGAIQRFEYTHELAWNVMKDYLEFQGNSEIRGSRDASREAFKINLITKGNVWMDMIISRNKTSHTYNEETANEIFLKVIREYYECFVAFQEKMETLRSGEQLDIFDKDI